MEFVNIPVKKDTKKLLDERKEEYGARTYDEVVRELAHPNVFRSLAKFRGSLKGTQNFKRDKRDRIFS